MFKAFREENKAEMMHLKDHHRFKLMAVLFKYFKGSGSLPWLSRSLMSNTVPS